VFQMVKAILVGSPNAKHFVKSCMIFTK